MNFSTEEMAALNNASQANDENCLLAQKMYEKKYTEKKVIFY